MKQARAEHDMAMLLVSLSKRLDECEGVLIHIHRDELLVLLRASGVTVGVAPDRAAPSATTTIRMGGAVTVCSDHDAACAEVPAGLRCKGCPLGVTGTPA